MPGWNSPTERSKTGRMKRLIAAASLAAIALPGSAPQARPHGQMGGYANPSAVIAAEIAFAQLAQEKGQWTAFRATSAPDAVMFVPQMAYAQQWLKDRADPAVAVKWQPHAVWSSCDGSVVVSHGAWQRPGSTGWFTTVWQRQPKGDYKWVLDHGDALDAPLTAPEFLSAPVADCPDAKERRHSAATSPPEPVKTKDLPVLDPALREGRSSDGTLTWRMTVGPDGARHFTASIRRNGAIEVIRDERVAAER